MDGAYKAAGVDTAEADSGLHKIISQIKATWPKPNGPNAVKLDIGYFANVIDIGGGIGLALCTDGVGTKSIIAEQLGRYDTIGIDCVAMNVNDLICVGARPVSMVDYIAVDRADAEMLGAIGVGLAEGARQAGISISGGEIAQLKEIVRGFDLSGTAVGTVPLNKIVEGQNLVPGDLIIGIESNGIHSNGLSLARNTLIEQKGLSLSTYIPKLGCSLGDELIRPTFIYVREILEILDNVNSVKALINITSDGLLNLTRVKASVGFSITELPPIPFIFKMIEEFRPVKRSEMFEVYNMGIGFCVLVSPQDVETTQRILARHRRRSWVIGEVIPDPKKRVHLPHEGLIGEGKHFRNA